MSVAAIRVVQAPMTAAPIAPGHAPPLDDLTLRRAQQGDERAWRALIARYQQPIHALVWRLASTRAPDRVPDLVQETFVRVLRALPQFDPHGAASLLTWILTIATRLALNELRRVKPLADGDAALASLAAPDRADDAVERARLAAAIGTAMARLPDAQRAVIVLREYHQLDHAAISAALEIDVGTVKSRLSRAKAALREHLIALGVVR